MEKRQIVTNTLISTLNVFVSGVSLFVLYRYFLDTIGKEAFGVWSVVLAVTSLGGAAGTGLHQGMVKFVAQYRARQDDAYAARIVQTAIITIFFSTSLIVFLLFFLLKEVLSFVLEPQFHSIALSLLPYALFSFWITTLNSIYESSIDGMQRVDIHNVIIIITTLFYLGLCFYLVPRSGLLGIARAQILQNILLLVLSITVLLSLMKTLPLFPTKWSWSIFKEIFFYGFNFQLISVSQMLLIPTTKIIISKFGGTGAVTYFEMANKMAFQIRSLISTGHQALVPTIAALYESEPKKLHNFYITSMRTMVFIILFLLPPMLFMIPTISRIWVGFYEPTFVLYGIILFTGWFLNLIVNPAYFNNMGTGQLRWNVIGQFVLGVSNVLLGIIIGWFVGTVGVVIGFALSLQMGTLITTVMYHRTHKIMACSILQSDDYRLLKVVLIGCIVSFILRKFLLNTVLPISLDGIVLICYFCFTLNALIRHPMRLQIGTWLGSIINSKHLDA